MEEKIVLFLFVWGFFGGEQFRFKKYLSMLVDQKTGTPGEKKNLKHRKDHLPLHMVPQIGGEVK